MYKTTQEETMGLYHEVYQLKRNPWSQEMAEKIHPEILEMLKEHLQHRWGPTLLEEE